MLGQLPSGPREKDNLKNVMRPCSKDACPAEASVTLTYDYEDQIAVLGLLSPSKEAHAHDLCPRHAQRFTAPAGWQVIRHISLSNDT